MYECGEISKFVSTNLLRLYEVVDDIYDEYLDKTKDLGPPPIPEDDSSASPVKPRNK